MPDDRLTQLAEAFELPSEAPRRLEALLELFHADPTAPTTVRDRTQALDVHIADSLSALDLAEIRTARVIADLGAGAGPPGLVLAAALPGAQVFAVESVQRKCAFLTRAITVMGLANAEVVCQRAEAWTAGALACDVVCARAVAPLGVLCEYAAPLLRLGGALVAWKGRLSEEEAANAAFAAERLGMLAPEAHAVRPYPGSHSRYLHVVRKAAPTPPEFPRRAGMAVKRPLRAPR